jgi:hypothetical protein
MKKHLPLLATTLLSFFLLQANAQSDTSRYDLGRIALQKRFTHAVTIKAADLEKMPFNTLSEAINMWLLGVYGGKQAYVTVIDGNLNDNVDAYSIYDIEEITLVQNTATLLNGISPSQYLLAIKTRRGRPGKSSVYIAGQTNVVKLRDNTIKTFATTGGESTSNIYNHYYVAAYANSLVVNAGISADFQHDAMPALKTVTFLPNNPYNFNRYKFNGYMDIKLGKPNTLSINAGYMPQTDNMGTLTRYTTIPDTRTYNSNGTYNLLHANIKLRTNIAGISNTLSAGFQNYNSNEHGALTQAQNNPPTFTDNTDSTGHIVSYLVKDDLSYKQTIGKFTIEPGVNLTYRQAKDTATYKSQRNNIATSLAQYAMMYKQKMVLLTPSLTLNYADAVSLQGGFQTLLNNNIDQPTLTGNKIAKLFPFASATFNVLKPANSQTQLMLYLSYAKTFTSLPELNTSLKSYGANTINNAPFFFSPFGYSIYDAKYNPYKTYDEVQAGLTLSLLKNRVSFSYNYNVRQYNAAYLALTSYGSGFLYLTVNRDTRLDIHQFNIDVKPLHTTNFSWESSFNATFINGAYNHHEIIGYNYMFDEQYQASGSFYNKFSYKKAFLGAGVIYRTHGQLYMYYTATTQTTNSFDIQNLYAGYNLNILKGKNLEVFANARNLFQNPQSDITDNRKFYGFGFKLGL